MPLNKELEARFTELGEDAIGEAESVECTLPQFAEGLETMIETLTMRLGQVREELSGQEDTDPDREINED